MAQRPTMPRGQRGHPVLVLLGVLLVPLMALLDYLVGPEFSFSLFYLIPIVVVARLGDWTSAWFTAVLAALAWMVIDILSGPPYSTFLAPLWNSISRLAFFGISLYAVRGLQEKLAAAEIRALSDPLTGLPNRKYLEIMLDAARARLERYGKPLTLAYLDIDNFKRLNDLHGHHAGDVMLKRIGQILVDSTRDTDTVARVGGDEFVMLLPEAVPVDAQPVLDRIISSLQSVHIPEGSDVTLSIGACTFHRPLESSEAMIRVADELMYRVKRSGKDAFLINEIR